jgi:hypothetical protein
MDNRIRFSSALIDFVNDVGITGQEHDNYPAPNSQARYDHIRMFLIGLLSSQSSENEPTQYRDGTVWFDLNTNIFKINVSDEWIDISNVLDLGGLTLQQWYDQVNQTISSATPEIVFNVNINANGITQLNIPTSLVDKVATESRCFVYQNGILLDPRNTIIVGAPPPPRISILNTTLSVGDRLTVVIKRIPSEYFYVPTVNLP